MISTVQHVLSQKNEQRVFCIQSSDLVFNAIQVMAQENIGALVVLDHGNIVGMVTERDYSRKVILCQRSSSNTRVHEIMTSANIYVTLEDRIDQCMKIMTEEKVRHLPVIDNGSLVGLISLGDVVKATISDQAFVIGQLSHFIQGGYTTDGISKNLVYFADEELLAVGT